MPRYYGGREPMARMAELPDDALRCICEQLVPQQSLRSNEEFMAEAREYCDEHTTWLRLACDEVDLDDVSAGVSTSRQTCLRRIRNGIGKGDLSPYNFA